MTNPKSKTVSIISELESCDDYVQAEEMLEEFAKASPQEKKVAEEALQKALANGRASEFVRSRIPDFIGEIGSERGKEVLSERLSKDKSGLVRGRIALSLIHYYPGDERTDLVTEQLEKERSQITRRIMVRALAASESSAAVPTLLKLIREDDDYIRHRAIVRLGEIQEDTAVDELISRLDDDDPAYVNEAILKALIAINDPKASPVFIRYLEKEELRTAMYITLVEGLSNLPNAKDDRSVEALLQAVCHENASVSITATNALVRLFRRPDAALKIARYGVQQADPDKYNRIADALRVIGDKGAIDYLRSLQNDPAQGPVAHAFLEQVGGQYAVDALINHRISALSDANKRVQQFDEQALTIFTDTVAEAKRGFKISIGMSVVIFAMGVILILAALLQGLHMYSKSLDGTPPTVAFAVIPFLTGGAGLASILTMFYRGPLERVERAVANLVQTEIAFLGYIRQVTQISAMFEREYLKEGNFSLADLRKLLQYTEHTMKETMPLVNQYTAVPFAPIQLEEVVSEPSES